MRASGAATANRHRARCIERARIAGPSGLE